MNTITKFITPASFDDIDFERRFGGIARLYGAAALSRFRAARVCVVGVGGVGSWIVEALARSAIGHLTLIDLDNVAESNINRQIQALSATLGQAKVTALAQRIELINPYCRVTEIEDFVTPDNLDTMIGAHDFDYVIDAIDSVKAKSALIAYCSAHAIPLITIGSAGGQIRNRCWRKSGNCCAPNTVFRAALKTNSASMRYFPPSLCAFPRMTKFVRWKAARKTTALASLASIAPVSARRWWLPHRSAWWQLRKYYASWPQWSYLSQAR